MLATPFVAGSSGLVQPGPQVVHPTAGMIPEGDAAIISASNRQMQLDIQAQTNGTVTSAAIPVSEPVGGEQVSSDAAPWTKLF